MEKKIKLKQFLCIVIVLILFILFYNTKIVYSFGIEDLSGTRVDNIEAKNVGNKIITFLSTIGSITSVIVLVVLGIKYMFGGIEEKVEYKKTMFPYLVGATLVFASSVIAGVIYNVVTQF